MKRPVLAVIAPFMLAAAACGGSLLDGSPGSPTGAAAPSSPAGDTTRFFAIEEIGLGAEGYVTLTNYTDQPASLDPGYLCQSDGCVDLPDVVVEPGAVARIAVGDGAGLDAVALTGASLDLTPSDGEVGLYGSTDFRDPKALRSYIQWGSTPHDLTEVAVEAGLWQVTGYAPSAAHATRLRKTEANLWVWDPGK